MAKLPIGLELWSVRHELADDVRGTLKAVAEMGYEGVEFAGPPQHSAEELKSILDETGLACFGWHTPFDLVQDDKLEDTIAFNKTIGNQFVIIPGLPRDRTQTRDDWLKMAGFFNELADKLAPHGMRTGYHNHTVEFKPLDGENPWDTLFGNTKDEVVMQFDTGNGKFGGADTLPILERYPGRATVLHLKPYSTTAAEEAGDPRAGFKPIIGEDDLPWDDIFRVAETTGGTTIYIVEYESDAFPPLEAVDKCLKALRAMGK